ncbi:MAG: tRNA threonylcarbamoyladenosine biosynthesis protein TsaE, partial [bacterium]
NIAKTIWNQVSKHNIVLFHGDLGAGKTTLIKEIGKQLGIQDNMSSPSFGIINEHEVSGEPLYHIDLYRVENTNEIYEFGLPEILDSGAYCFVEWPEMTKEIWHDYDCSEVFISVEKSGSRRIFVK